MPHVAPGEPGFVPRRKPTPLQRILSGIKFQRELEKFPLARVGETERVFGLARGFNTTRGDKIIAGRFSPKSPSGAFLEEMKRRGVEHLYAEDSIQLSGSFLPREDDPKTFETVLSEFRHRAINVLKKDGRFRLPQVEVKLRGDKRLGTLDEEALVHLLGAATGTEDEETADIYLQRLFGNKAPSAVELIENPNVSKALLEMQSTAAAVIALEGKTTPIHFPQKDERATRQTLLERLMNLFSEPE